MTEVLNFEGFSCQLKILEMTVSIMRQRNNDSSINHTKRVCLIECIPIRGLEQDVKKVPSLGRLNTSSKNLTSPPKLCSFYCFTKCSLVNRCPVGLIFYFPTLGHKYVLFGKA